MQLSCEVAENMKCTGIDFALRFSDFADHFCVVVIQIA